MQNKLVITGGIYFCTVPHEVPAETEAGILCGLPRLRRERAEKYMLQNDRLLSAAVWYLLRYAVNDICGLDCFSFPIGVGKSRKPFFEGIDGVHFNLSHCRSAAVCAVDFCPCGTDVEPLRTADPKVVRRVMPGRYDEFMQTAPGRERNEFYTRSWVETESIYKSGIVWVSGALPEDYQYYDFRTEGYFIGLCAKQRNPAVKLKTAEFSRIVNFR